MGDMHGTYMVDLLVGNASVVLEDVEVLCAACNCDLLGDGLSRKMLAS